MRKIIIDIIRTLSKGEKSFRSHDEKEDSNERGLFLEILKALKKYIIQNLIDT